MTTYKFKSVEEALPLLQKVILGEMTLPMVASFSGCRLLEVTCAFHEIFDEVDSHVSNLEIQLKAPTK